jgi:hypothetical protein
MEGQMSLKALSKTVTDEQRNALKTDVVIDNNIVTNPAEVLRQSFIVRLENVETEADAKSVLNDVSALQDELSAYDDVLNEIGSAAADIAGDGE